jgi:lipopolysaccharide/colanic/teichoic acid biosynthesis glycosyltransferase
MKRTFDLSIALISILLLLPLFILVALLIVTDSKGGIFYKQKRVGKNKTIFYIYKFRTMVIEHSYVGQLTIGDRDPRITKLGYWLRKYKIDELPQLINILKGEMSFVGPRPEVKKYVDLYNSEQERVLSVKPGITDWASIKFCGESKLLARAKDPERYYIKEIIPLKISHSLHYIDHHDFWIDLKIIFLTLQRIVKN